MFVSHPRNLIAEGYTVFTNRARLFLFHVVKPCGTIYQVNPVENTCTCRAGELGKPCCHRAQLQDLLRHCSRRLLELSAEVQNADFTQAAMLVAEVEEMISQWKDVQEARGAHIAPALPAHVAPAAPAISPRVAAYHADPARFAIWGQNSRNRAWVLLGSEYRSREQAEKVRTQVYAVSSRYAQTTVRPFRALATA